MTQTKKPNEMVLPTFVVRGTATCAPPPGFDVEKFLAEKAAREAAEKKGSDE